MKYHFIGLIIIFISSLASIRSQDEVQTFTWFIEDAQNQLSYSVLEMVQVNLNPYEIIFEQGSQTESDILFSFSNIDSSQLTVEVTKPAHLNLPTYGLIETKFGYPIRFQNSDKSTLTDYLTGVLLYTSGNCQNSLNYFSKVKAKDYSVHASIAFYGGVCAIESGNYQKAEEYFRGIQDTPYTSDNSPINNAVYNLAWLYMHKGDEQAAFGLINSDIQDAPNEYYLADALAHRAYLHSFVFDYDSAIQDINQAVDIDPLNPERYVQRGQIIMLLYEWDRVLEDYNQALEIAPNYADAYFYRGVLYYSILQRELALADFEQYLSLAPDGVLAKQAAHYENSIQLEIDNLNGSGSQ